MELEYSDRNSRRSKVYIAAGSIVALLVAATVYLALQASGLTQADEVVTRDVVVAAGVIGVREPVGAEDVAVRRVIADPTNETAFTSVDQVVGRILSVPVVAGQLIDAEHARGRHARASRFSILEPGEVFDPERAPTFAR